LSVCHGVYGLPTLAVYRVAKVRQTSTEHSQQCELCTRRLFMERMLVVVFNDESKAYEGSRALNQLDGE
jgi:hypothetical protein